MLQHSLLPERLPLVPGMATAARYLPGGAGVDIGGDWYDVMQLPDGDGRSGHGRRRRQGERGRFAHGAAPQRPPGLRLRGASRPATSWTASTVSCSTPAPTTWPRWSTPSSTPRAVSSGWPTPATRRRCCAADGRAPGCSTARTARRSGRCRPPAMPRGAPCSRPGTTLLLYTDGLVEDRDDVARTRASTGLRTAATDGPARTRRPLFAHRARHSRRRPERRRRRPPGRADHALDDRLHLRVPAQPGVLSPLRATLRRWLIQAGASETEAYELLTACGEACTNAIRHASGPLRSDFEVEAAIVDGASRSGSVTGVVAETARGRRREGPAHHRGLRRRPRGHPRAPQGTEVRMRRRLAGTVPFRRPGSSCDDRPRHRDRPPRRRRRRPARGRHRPGQHADHVGQGPRERPQRRHRPRRRPLGGPLHRQRRRPHAVHVRPVPARLPPGHGHRPAPRSRRSGSC